VREALHRLGVDSFVFGIHEAALPSAPGPETGRGSLASTGGRAFLEQIHALGFDAVQLGPSGMTGFGNPSPYDGTLFSKSLLSADLLALAESPDWSGLLTHEELDGLLAGCPAGAGERVPYEWTWSTYRRALWMAGARFERRRRAGAAGDLEPAFREFSDRNWNWLEGDALYEALSTLHGTEDWRRWPSRIDRELWSPQPADEPAARDRHRELHERLSEAVQSWCFSQWVVDRQRTRAREDLRRLGLSLYGDVQVGMSPRDEWRLLSLFVPGYLLGAPPSRTNPEGQPWGYPVFHPERVFADGSPPPAWPVDPEAVAPGPVLRFLDVRFERAFAEYDALRVDHPHGLVCPWVYRAGQTDPFAATRAGTRLLSALEDSDHPELAPWAIPRPDQIDRSSDPWADGRVRELDDAQVARYGQLLERALRVAERTAGGAEKLICEVLSTMPYPLRRVMERRAMGRFRVTHKASLDDPEDVYRTENARAEDWVMLTTQDTPTIWHVVSEWTESGEHRARAAHLARRLADEPSRRAELERELASDARSLATGMLAELLACRAGHVLVFFTDLLGMVEPYNRPGVASEENWTLRAPALRPDAEQPLPLDVPGACALALRARGVDDPELVSALETAAR
jgi:4-alpha-glucanotransferase